LASHKRHRAETVAGPTNLHIRRIANERDGSVASETRERGASAEEAIANCDVRRQSCVGEEKWRERRGSNPRPSA
jgi:hypothetical protein